MLFKQKKKESDVFDKLLCSVYFSRLDFPETLVIQIYQSTDFDT